VQAKVARFSVMVWASSGAGAAIRMRRISSAADDGGDQSVLVVQLATDLAAVEQPLWQLSTFNPPIAAVRARPGCAKLRIR